MDLKKTPRKVTVGIVTIVALAGGSMVGSDLAVETISEESTKYEKILDGLTEKATNLEQAHLKAVQALVNRRAKGDEPTFEEWLQVESAIDELRVTNDSPLLQRLDRFIEVMDAQNKNVRTEVADKLKSL